VRSHGSSIYSDVIALEYLYQKWVDWFGVKWYEDSPWRTIPALMFVMFIPAAVLIAIAIWAARRFRSSQLQPKWLNAIMLSNKSISKGGLKMRLFYAFIMLIGLILSGCSDDKITGYETKVVFVPEEGFFHELQPTINQYTKQGWEIKGTRRAWKKGIAVIDKERNWGTEYTLQRPIHQK